MKSLTWAEVCRRRLRRQHLTQPAAASAMTEVVSAVCGIQAQVITAAELAIGARVEGVTQEDLREALWERHSLVKTYGPRGTLHLLPASELSPWMAAMRAREDLLEQPWYAGGDLTQAQAEALIKGIGEALDGRCLSRDELAQEVAGRVGGWAQEKLGSTWGEWLAPAAFRGLLCYGPSRGSKVTFVRADQWIRRDMWRESDPAEALREVLRRYLAAYGPATHVDFARWFWLKPDKSRDLFESIKSELTEVEVEGKRAWVLSAEEESTEQNEAPLPLKLLPQYDCYVLGAVPRERLVPEAAKRRIMSYGRGRFEGAVGLNVLLSDGVVAGIWERKVSGKRLSIRVEPFVDITPEQREHLDAEAARVGVFLGKEATLSVGTLA